MTEKKSFVLRISPELWDALQRLAAEEFRSVNGQIEHALTEHLRSKGRLPVQTEETQDDS